VPKQPFIFRFVMSTPAIVVAAVLVIAVGAAVFIGQRNHSQTPTLVKSNDNELVNPAPTATVGAKDKTVDAEQPKPPENNVTDKSKIAPIIVRNTPKSSSPFSGLPQATTIDVKPASIVRLSDRAGEVSLITPDRPMVVTMYDEHGATRKIQLPPISFGSQRLTDNRKQVSMANTKDW
jgi:hypothetical protein